MLYNFPVARDRIFLEMMRLVLQEGLTDHRVVLGKMRVRKEREEWGLLCQMQIAMLRDRPLSLLRLAGRLLAKGPHPWFRAETYYFTAWAYNILGDLASGEAALRMAGEHGLDQRNLAHRLAFMRIMREDFHGAREQLATVASPVSETDYIRAILDLLEGNISGATRRIRGLLEKPGAYFHGGAWEILGMAERTLGRTPEAARAFIRSMEWFLERGSHYAAVPLVKHLELVATCGAKPPDGSLVRRILSLARSGGPAERAALLEYRASGLWIKGDTRGASALFLEAGAKLSAAASPAEAFLAHLKSAYTGYVSGSESFFKAVEYLRPRLRLYRFVEADAFYADFIRSVLCPIARFSVPREPDARITMFGGLSVEGFSLSGWVSRKALTLLKYLLLNQGRGLSAPYLAYLLWPRKDERAAMARLRQEVYYIRKHSGPLGKLLVSEGGRYLVKEDEGLWLDTSRFRALIGEDSVLATDPLERYLAALEIYRGHLLPEDRYDRFIEEHRDAFHREFCAALEKALELLSGRKDEALALARKFYEQFPEDNRVAMAYTRVLVQAGRRNEALSVYEEFRNRLWRMHRKKPDFQSP